MLRNISQRLNMSAIQKRLVAFDFDHTIIDENSDLYVRKLLPGGKVPEEIKSIYSDRGWTKYMGAIFRKLYENGSTKQDFLNCMNELEFTSGMKELLEYLSEKEDEVIIISDSNSFFIDCILKESGMLPHITKVFTNPAKFDSDGCLLVDYYHTQDWCDLSTVNLCKGHILDAYVQERKEAGVTFKQVIYVGDGHNDLCPSLRLKSSDFVCPRKGYRLLKAIRNIKDETSQPLLAKVIEWDNGNDILNVLQSE
ncbi:unnamed protein product [Owenia fusiformis]|uniref:Uncharacterized protein n=1 Tax=Owenia fusiformis TaxID=6347 RepID=A0A8J1XRC1_OWEFU|nr:unnamed protein product [Owenia fusiformis]